MIQPPTSCLRDHWVWKCTQQTADPGLKTEEMAGFIKPHQKRGTKSKD